MAPRLLTVVHLLCVRRKVLNVLEDAREDIVKPGQHLFVRVVKVRVDVTELRARIDLAVKHLRRLEVSKVKQDWAVLDGVWVCGVAA